MRYFVSILLCLVLTISCQDLDRAKKPKDLIPEDKMVDVLIEISLLQAARTYNRQELINRGIEPEEYIWEKFDIDSSRFARSNNYYATNYAVYQEIYDKVKDSLESLKVRYDSIREREEMVQDSIRKAKRVKDSINQLDSLKVPLDSLRVDTLQKTVPKVSRPRRLEIRNDPV